jgi:hypothetical protein
LFPADNHATFDKQILEISRAQVEPQIKPDGVSAYLRRTTVALEADIWCLHCGK